MQFFICYNVNNFHLSTSQLLSCRERCPHRSAKFYQIERPDVGIGPYIGFISNKAKLLFSSVCE